MIEQVQRSSLKLLLHYLNPIPTRVVKHSDNRLVPLCWFHRELVITFFWFLVLFVDIRNAKGRGKYLARVFLSGMRRTERSSSYANISVFGPFKFGC